MHPTEVELFLQSQSIPFTPYEFKERPVEPQEIPVFKTLVLKGDKSGPLVALIPLNARLDYKKTAKLTGNRKVGLPSIESVLEITGYPHGANTPIGIFIHQGDILMIFDKTIQDKSKIIVSAGELGKGVAISTQNLIQLIQPTIANILVDS